MKLLVAAFKKIFKLYYNSFLSVHFIILAISLILYYFTVNYIDSKLISDNYVGLLNGMGVLMSFFILVIDKMELSKLNIKYGNRVNIPFRKRQIREGSKALNLIFSITFSMFSLLGLQYIILFFDLKIALLLILLILNIFSGFIIVLVLWHNLVGESIKYYV